MTRHLFRNFLFALLLLVFAGCAQPPAPEQTPQQPAGTPPPGTAATPPSSGTEIGQKDEALLRSLDAGKIRLSEANRGRCYELRPARVTVHGKKHRVTGHCQPQSLIYARCRTGIMTCKLGDTSPVQWFACAKRSGNTLSRPAAGSVMVLDANSHRGMPTGHPMYVEEVKANGDGTWTLRISHTNYDRKCHLDLDSWVIYDQARMTATFRSGPWSAWASNLKVLGFIFR